MASSRSKSPSLAGNPPPDVQQNQNQLVSSPNNTGEITLDGTLNSMAVMYPESSATRVKQESPEVHHVFGVEGNQHENEYDAVPSWEPQRHADLDPSHFNDFDDFLLMENDMDEEELECLASYGYFDCETSASSAAVQSHDPSPTISDQFVTGLAESQTFEEYITEDLHDSSFNGIHGVIQPLDQLESTSSSMVQFDDLDIPTADIPRPFEDDYYQFVDGIDGSYPSNAPYFVTTSFLETGNVTFYNGPVLGPNATLGAATPLDDNERYLLGFDGNSRQNMTFGGMAEMNRPTNAPQGEIQDAEIDPQLFDVADSIEKDTSTRQWDLSNEVNIEYSNLGPSNGAELPEHVSDETVGLPHFADLEPDKYRPDRIIAPYDTSKNKYLTWCMNNGKAKQQKLPHYSNYVARKAQLDTATAAEFPPSTESSADPRKKAKLVLHIRDDELSSDSDSSESTPDPIAYPLDKSDPDDGDYRTRAVKRRRVQPMRQTLASIRASQRNLHVRNDKRVPPGPVSRPGVPSLVVKLRLPSAGTVANLRLGNTGSSFTPTTGYVNSTTFVDIPARLHIDTFPKTVPPLNVFRFRNSIFVIKLKFADRPEPTVIALDHYWRFFAHSDNPTTLVMAKKGTGPKTVTFHGAFQAIRLRKCTLCQKRGVRCDSRGPCGACIDHRAAHPNSDRIACRPVAAPLLPSDFNALGLGNPDAVLCNGTMPPWIHAPVQLGTGLRMVADFVGSRIASQNGLWRIKDRKDSGSIVVLDHSPTKEDRKKYAFGNLAKRDDGDGEGDDCEEGIDMDEDKGGSKTRKGKGKARARREDSDGDYEE